MLRTLKIKNFALIADQTIEFKKGFNVLVGETGAGKSLILDALGFVMGDKANKLNLRHGEEKMSVQAVFDCLNNNVIEELNNYDIDVEEIIIFSRNLNSEGRSESRINGTIVPNSVVKQIASLILDTYAQNENIELLKVKNHLNFLDLYAPERVDLLKKELNDILVSYNDNKKKMELLGGSNENRDRELEILEYQIKDIENANLKIGEDDELKSEIDKLSNYEKVFSNVKIACDSLASINDYIHNVENSLATASNYDSNLDNLKQRISSSKIELADLEDSLATYIDEFQFDSNRLEQLDNRLEDIKALKRKYGNTIEDIFSYLNKIQNDYDNLLFGEEKLKRLTVENDNLRKKLYDVSCRLSNERKSIATNIELCIESELKLLGFKNAVFKVYFKEIPDLENAIFSKSGLDQVEFLLSANAGEELKSLSKTISGGEMSRFMLAIKNVFAKSFNSSTLVFDEVDTGISGEIGQRVAERLAMLSKNYQLICITHLCQVTAMADNYLYVKKEVRDNKTYTVIKELEGEEIIQFIALVSGAEPTDVALTFARELKLKAEKYKNSI